MTVVVVKRAKPTKYETTCTDKNCRAVLRFDQTDIKYNSTYSMGRTAGSYEGVVCPECNQVLKIKDFAIIPDNENE